MSITGKELAAMLGLSESAVSLALNDKPGVSRATRQRVIEAAKQYGFDFSSKTVTAVGKKGTICFLIYKKSGAVVSDTPFFSTLTDGISMGCRRRRYDFLPRRPRSDSRRIRRIPRRRRVQRDRRRRSAMARSCDRR